MFVSEISVTVAAPVHLLVQTSDPGPQPQRAEAAWEHLNKRFHYNPSAMGQCDFPVNCDSQVILKGRMLRAARWGRGGLRSCNRKRSFVLMKRFLFFEKDVSDDR